MVHEVEGNLLTYDGIEVIAHQTNCFGIMGGGIAKQIRDRNPNLYQSYKEFCNIPNRRSILGSVQFLKTDDNKQIVANLFGEYSIYKELTNEDGTRRDTDYNALKSCLAILYNYLKQHNIKTVGIPYKLGCGLDGGNWNDVVYPMVKEIFEQDEDITLYIVKYNG